MTRSGGGFDVVVVVVLVRVVVDVVVGVLAVVVVVVVAGVVPVSDTVRVIVQATHWYPPSSGSHH